MDFINLEKFKKKIKLYRKSKEQDAVMLPSFIQLQTKSRKKAEAALADLEVNHNTSWVRDLYNKNKKRKNLFNVALFYRGQKITYRQLFAYAEVYAEAFATKGVKKGDEIPICMSNVPEFVYIIMGLNLLGAKAHVFGSDFLPEFLTEIMDDCSVDFVICTDDKYPKIMDSIVNSSKKEIIMVSLADSLPNGKDPYIEFDKDFYDFKNKVLDFKAIDSHITTIKEFLSLIDNKKIKQIIDYNFGNLDTEFLITYSSGTTDELHPKAIVHTNRSLITIGRFQDSDLSGLPEMTDLIGEMIIPNHSNTSIISSMSDVLYKGCTVAIEPIYHDEFLLRSFEINKPNYISVPRQMLVNSMKQLYNDAQFENFTMPYMMMLTSVGEPTSMGEEKFINKMLRKAKAGVSRLPRPFSPVPLSIGGGDCERGGMFFTSYRRYRDFLPKYSLTKTRCELKQYTMVQSAILDSNGNELPYGQVGRLVLNTPTTMKHYKNNEEATKKFYITDSLGRKWTDGGVYAIIEKHGTVKMLERIGREVILDDGTIMPLFRIGQLVELDTKNILSYEVVNVDNLFVVHVELHPDRYKSQNEILKSIHERIIAKYGDKVANKVLYRVRSFLEGFPSSKCGKRSYPKLKEEGIGRLCLAPVYTNDSIIFHPVTEMDNPKQYYIKK